MVLTSAEKVKAYRQRLRDNGGKTFAIDIGGEKLGYITNLAQMSNKSESIILREVFEVSLNRFIRIQHIGIQMLADGYTIDQADKYLHDNFDPELTNPLDYKEINQ